MASNGVDQNYISRRGFFREIAAARHSQEEQGSFPPSIDNSDPHVNGTGTQNINVNLGTESFGDQGSNSHQDTSSHVSGTGSNSTPLSTNNPWSTGASLRWNQPHSTPRSYPEYGNNDYNNNSASNGNTESKEGIDVMNRTMDARLNVSPPVLLHKTNPAYKGPLEIHAEKKRQVKSFLLKLLYFLLCLLFIVGFGLMLESAKLLGYVDSIRMQRPVDKGDLTNSGRTANSTPERANAITQMLKEISGEAVEKNGSAQNRAAQWIIYTDKLQLSVPVAPMDKRRFLQRFALATLYYATNGEQWSKQYNFLSGLDECEWNQEKKSFFTGAGNCNESHMITMITLWNNNLHGVIPKEIAILTDLKVLSLFDNMLIGNVPDELTALDNLEKIYLHKNLLSGNMDFLCVLKISDMRGDCEGPDPKISCTCCNVCCKRSGTCFED